MQNQSNKKPDTLGELLAAASEVAFEYSNSEQEAYRLARIALVEILKSASHPKELDEEFGVFFLKKNYFH